MRLWAEKVYTTDYSRSPYTNGYKWGVFLETPRGAIHTLVMIPLERRHVINLCYSCSHTVMKRFWMDGKTEMPYTPETEDYTAMFKWFCGLAASRNPLAIVNMPEKCPFYDRAQPMGEPKV